jgi:transcriptional regulator with PAS, ATPase and Fis domain
VDVRVVAATNKDPQQAVSSGQLRGDLYYRLNVFNIRMPPLREHLSDIPAIAQKMIDDMNERHHCTVSGLAPDVLSRLMAYDWPGNVRELRNTIERATVLAGTGVISATHLPPGFGEPGYGVSATASAEMSGGVRVAVSASPRTDANSVVVEVGTTVDEAEKQLILKTLASTNNNKTRAAEILGITTKTLQNKLKEYAATAAGSTSPEPSSVSAE